VAVVPRPGNAQTDDFESLVEEALGREAPDDSAQPESAVPPRLRRPGAAADPEPEQRDLDVPAAETVEPAMPLPGLTEESGTAQEATQPEPAQGGPRPYTPPRKRETRRGRTGEASSGQTAEQSATDNEPQSEAAERAELRIEDVNEATFDPGSAKARGTSPIVLKAQILLDRAGASPGVIDGIYGSNVAKAISAVETVLGLPVNGELDADVWAALGGDQAPPVLVEYTITEEDAAYPFLSEIPADYAEQAKLESLGFTSPEEMFSERFHMDIELLKALNPGADFRRAGETIIVAAVEGQPVTGKVARIEADKRARQVRAYDAEDRLIVAYPATIGSSENPSPSGTHQVNAVADDPVYYYNPENFVQGENREPLELPPGPNNPVGTMWIDLSEPTYGIHGTPEPSKIDKTGSHGCVRLTNWDAEELATLVDPGVPVTFVE